MGVGEGQTRRSCRSGRKVKSRMAWRMACTGLLAVLEGMRKANSIGVSCLPQYASHTSHLLPHHLEIELSEHEEGCSGRRRLQQEVAGPDKGRTRGTSTGEQQSREVAYPIVVGSHGWHGTLTVSI